MKLGEKITQIRKEKGLKIKDVHKRIKELFGKKALSYRTLLRLEADETDGRGSSLYQLCLGLGVTLKELKEGTEEENTIADFVKRDNRQGSYVYTDRARAEILTGPNRKLLALELIIAPHGKTNIEQDPHDERRFEKLLYMLKGELACVIEGKSFKLRKGDSISFNSSLAHSFQNNTGKVACCILIQNPRSL